MLAQKDNIRKEYVVVYTSWALIASETNYNPFVVVTDHAVLKWLQTAALTGHMAY
ncbi:21359_t:CDS:2 [Dentiscutata erythropus]|uniref:21359_t:CDS:1 n=1 Tax=Dentiscutata erythropus TaxID=1348616 RepID=A0A9N8VWB0_9GLOM|nr:21359_t:CDS:2 [Dentiscutata erythropus]